MGDASSVKILLAKEATFGVNPTGAGKFDVMRFTSESLGLDVGNVQSAEIDSTRQPSGNVRTSLSASGGISMEHSLQTSTAVANGTQNGFDKLIEGALMSSWSTIVADTAQSVSIGAPSGGQFTVTDDATTSVLFSDFVVGQWMKLSNFNLNSGALNPNGIIYARILEKTTTEVMTCEGVQHGGDPVIVEGPLQTDIAVAGSHLGIGQAANSYTIERQYTDLTTPEYTEYLGMMVNRWSMSLSPQAIFTMDFDFLGKIQNTQSSGSTTGGTDNVKWATPRLNAVDHFKQRMVDSFDGESTDRLLEISFTLDNRLRTEPELGVLGSTNIGLSTPTLEGTVRIYMQDGSMIRAAEDGTLSKLAFRLDDGTRQQILTFPSILFGRPDAPASGNDQGVIVTLPFFAEPDATNNIAFTVDRF